MVESLHHPGNIDHADQLSIDRTHLLGQGVGDALRLPDAHIADVLNAEMPPIFESDGRELFDQHRLSVDEEMAVRKIMYVKSQPAVPAAVDSGSFAKYQEFAADAASTARTILISDIQASGKEVKEAEISDGHAVQYLLDKTAHFYETAQQHEAKLHGYKQEFTDKVLEWSSDQGLPLTATQIHTRLDDLRIRFATDMHLGGAEGGQNGIEGVRINARFAEGDEQYLQKMVFHELLHALSGQDGNRRTGLRMNSGPSTGEVANEAVTELLAEMMTSDRVNEVRFDEANSSLWTEVGEPMVQDAAQLLSTDQLYEGARNIEKAVYLRLSSAIPARVLADAYFKQDNDPYEPDQRAGSHALRELNRYNRMLGSKDRLDLMRQLDRGVSDVYSDSLKGDAFAARLGDAVKRAAVEGVNDLEQDPENTARRSENARQVAEHTQSIQQKIAAARAHSKTSHGIGHSKAAA